MRKAFSCAVALLIVPLGLSLYGAAQPAAKKKIGTKTGAKKSVPRRPPPAGVAQAKSANKMRMNTLASRPKPSGSKVAGRKGKKGAPRHTTTWRNRQLAPTPQRYKEIQDALAAKGYLKPEEANGQWNQASADAMKRFQAEQNLESSGKLNSLSLIALGLGPKRDAPASH